MKKYKLNESTFDLEIITDPRYIDKLDKSRIKCSCSHTVFIPNKIDRIICQHCGYWVYRTPKLKFIYEMKEKWRVCK